MAGSGLAHYVKADELLAEIEAMIAFAAWQFWERCAGRRHVQLGAPSKRPDSIRMRKPVVTSVVTNDPAICRPGPGAWQVPRAGDLEHHPQSLAALSLS
jgi:hypothetical protein